VTARSEEENRTMDVEAPESAMLPRLYASAAPEPFFWRMSPDVLDAIKAEAASDGHEWSLEPVKIIGRRYVVDADLPPGTLIASTDWRCRSHGELLGERRFDNAEYDIMTGRVPERVALPSLPPRALGTAAGANERHRRDGPRVEVTL
jgi:hypothetical protein